MPNEMDDADRPHRTVLPLGKWRLEAAPGSQIFTLTLITPDGLEVAFSLSAAAIVGITSVIEAHSSEVDARTAALLPDWS
jgi:hypothetical protein